MRLAIMKRGLPVLVALMAVSVLLILSGASSVGLTFGLVVAGMTGLMLVATVLHDVIHSARPRERRLYRAPHMRCF